MILLPFEARLLVDSWEIPREIPLPRRENPFSARKNASKKGIKSVKFAAQVNGKNGELRNEYE